MKRGYSMVRRCCIRGCDGMAQPVDVVCARCAEELAAFEAMDARPGAGYRGRVVQIGKPAWWRRQTKWAVGAVVVVVVMLVLWSVGEAHYPPGAEAAAYVAADAQR